MRVAGCLRVTVWPEPSVTVMGPAAAEAGSDVDVLPLEPQPARATAPRTARTRADKRMTAAGLRCVRVVLIVLRAPFVTLLRVHSGELQDPMAVALLAAVPDERDGRREQRCGADHRVVLALFAAGVGAGGLELGDELRGELAPEERSVELRGVDGDHGGPDAALQQLAYQPAPRLLPERQVARQVRDLTDLLDPDAVPFEVDVAEHAGLHALPPQLVEDPDERGFVVVPRGSGGDERDAERLGLRLEERHRQAVTTAAVTVLVQHAHQRLGPAACGDGPREREVRVLAAAPRAEEAAAGQSGGAVRLTGRRSFLAAPGGGVRIHASAPPSRRQSGQMP